MKILFIADPLADLKPYKDSTVFMMREAAQRGHAVYACEMADMAMMADASSARDASNRAAARTQARVSARVSALALSPDNASWVRVTEQAEVALRDMDVVVMRKDPPFDQEYLYATLLLTQAEAEGACVVNRAASLRDYNEKLSIAKFPQFMAPTLVTRDMARMHAFIDLHQDVIIKKLDGMGGTSIFRVRADDLNRNAILQAQTLEGTSSAMAQKFIPDISAGDKRILLIDGEAAPYSLARIPKAGETRGNLAQGGKGVAQPLSERDREIAAALGPQMQKDGLVFVGLDVIGDYLTEINVTSPTCMVEIFDQTGFNSATRFIEALERIAQAQDKV
jgi:glutathione synthase